MDISHKVWIRGAGELASATACSLYNAGFNIVMSELPQPLAIRRKVSFSDAVHTEETAVEGIVAVKGDVTDTADIMARGCIAMVIDNSELPRILNPDIIIDGRMLKRAGKGKIPKAFFTVGLGPGFHAGRDCDAVIETQRGHHLGRIIWEGTALPATGVPGVIAGETIRRVLYAPTDGHIKWAVDIGDIVIAEQILGNIGSDHEIHAPLSGLVRGLISPLSPITKGLKIADIDPRGNEVDHRTISDKARAVGRGALEAVMIHLNRSESRPSG